LHRFYENRDGRSPVGQLIRDSNHNLFGVAFGSGGVVGGVGMVFELQLTKEGHWNETILHDFAGGTDGSYPEGGLVSDGNGHLYGTTSRGGTAACSGEQSWCGTVYEITP